MIGHIVTCAYVDCDNDFPKLTHNMKFCSPECCKIQTSLNLKQDYHEKKAIKSGKERICATCSTKLSRYNTSRTCSACDKRTDEGTQMAVNDIMASALWA